MSAKENALNVALRKKQRHLRRREGTVIFGAGTPVLIEDAGI